MKIRGRLIIAFLFVTIFPLALIAVSYNMILTNQASTLEDDYQSDISSENLLLNPIHILSTATMTDFRNLVHVADTNPDLLIRRDYLDKINSEIVRAVYEMGKVKTGALIVMEKQVILNDRSLISVTQRHITSSILSPAFAALRKDIRTPFPLITVIWSNRRTFICPAMNMHSFSL